MVFKKRQSGVAPMSEEARAAFARVEAEFEATLAAFAEGAINQATLAQRLAELRVTDPGGAQWTIGVETRQWYRRSSAAEPWKLAQPL